MAKEYDPQAFEQFDPGKYNTEPTVETALEATVINVESNVAPPNFPASKRAVAQALDTTDMTIGRLTKALEERGVMILNRAGKVTESGYSQLSALGIATREQGVRLGDYLDTVQPSQDFEPFLDTPSTNTNTIALSTQKYESRANLALSRQANGQAKALGLIESLKHSQALTRTRRTTGKETTRANAINHAVEDAEVYISAYSQTHNQILEAFHGVDGGVDDCKSR